MTKATVNTNCYFIGHWIVVHKKARQYLGTIRSKYKHACLGEGFGPAPTGNLGVDIN